MNTSRDCGVTQYDSVASSFVNVCSFSSEIYTSQSKMVRVKVLALQNGCFILYIFSMFCCAFCHEKSGENCSENLREFPNHPRPLFVEFDTSIQALILTKSKKKREETEPVLLKVKIVSLGSGRIEWQTIINHSPSRTESEMEGWTNLAKHYKEHWGQRWSLWRHGDPGCSRSLYSRPLCIRLVSLRATRGSEQIHVLKTLVWRKALVSFVILVDPEG